MGRIQVVLSKESEEKLRLCVRHKGDVSRIVEEALQMFFKKVEDSA
jgi:hypothetical protein